MILDLSSKITLERIPQRYYRPADALEAVRQSRFEKLRTDIFDDEVEGAVNVAQEIAALIRSKQKENDNCVLALPGGSSPMGVYAELVRMHKEEGLSFKMCMFLTYRTFILWMTLIIQMHLCFVKT